MEEEVKDALRVIEFEDILREIRRKYKESKRAKRIEINISPEGSCTFSIQEWYRKRDDLLGSAETNTTE